ncbi:hypothetical protein A3Q56_00761 [Intoshia linei]|uniref:Peptidase M14 domain-containing protein n=1 Tax=Intoshia linei TaxID=1819745 RepID=A0A177BB41_9BILA|nr:hypothetical protein A3Q56_00761 [Intoshia linei]
MTTSFIPDANLPSLNNVYLNLKEKMKLYPNLVKITDIGTSTQYRNIKSVEITNNINLLEIGKPSVRYIANMHGDEVVGLYLMHNFINYLTSQNDTFVNTLLDCLKFIIVPTMNPDAYYETYKYNNTHKQRNNLNNYDLNRNFPDRVITTVFPVQPETIAIMKWMNNSDVVLSANIHGGDVVVNYPFDGNMESTTIYTGTKDDDVFRHISLTYAKYNPRMGNNHSCYQNEKGFKYGITNGAA